MTETLENAFDKEFLGLLDRLDEIGPEQEGELAGPWKVVKVAGGYGLFEVWKVPTKEDLPLAVVEEKTLAFKLLAAVSAASREPLIQLGEREEAGFPVLSNRRTEGYLRIAQDRVVELAHMADFCTRWPPALAALLLASSSATLRKAGEIVLSTLREELPAGEEGV
jgi:hypothetical protein